MLSASFLSLLMILAPPPAPATPEAAAAVAAGVAPAATVPAKPFGHWRLIVRPMAKTHPYWELRIPHPKHAGVEIWTGRPRIITEWVWIP